MKSFALVLACLFTAITVARAEDMTAAETAKAQHLFTTSCASCHRKHHDPINPKAFSEQKWNKWVTKMMPISRLKDEDAQLLTTYLTAVRAGKAELPKDNAAPAEKKK